MDKPFYTMDDFDFHGKIVLTRIDINTPIDPKTSELMDDRRFLSHKETILELIEKDARIVLMAHQGRPGDPDFTTLEKHSKLLSEILDTEVKYIDTIFSSYARECIKSLENSEILLLENVRFYSEEVINKPPDAQAKTFIVKKLSEVADLYVNDAFGTAHRSQPTIVGFPMVMKSAAGRLMQREIETIEGILKNPEKPLIFVLGGTKVDDSLKIAEKALMNGADLILTGGVVANVFLAAKGYRLGEPTIEFIRGKKMVDQIDVAKSLLERFEDKIVLPDDVAIEQSNERIEIDISELPINFRINDIGSKTVEKYKNIIKNAGTIFANGALGYFEDEKFAYGTREIIKAIAESNAFSVIGGGHTVAAARRMNLTDKITHVSSGGSACVNLLAGYKLPAVEALKMSKEKFPLK
ncbi:MAG TPA: phosphoglycerate kinase [Candidatus Altiarchaeales archaeon]|nr:phosphoglycerate kinase [Candidatus Altiarchaeales archaeon]